MNAPNGRRKFAIVRVQFRFPSSSAIPQFTRQLARRVSVSDHVSLPGSALISPTEDTSLAVLLDDLATANYTLVGALCEERSNTNGGTGTHFVVKYTLAPPSTRIKKPDPTFLRRQDLLERELREIATSALFRTKSFAKPFRKNGEPVEGAFVAHIVADARRPFIQGDGKPVAIWQKDAAGERIGDAPIPLAPSFHLRAPLGRTLQLQAA